MYYSYKTPFAVGVNTNSFNKVYAHQQNSMWCWAACIEMVLKHKGINISQRQFAAHTCGVNANGIPYNCPAGFDAITEHLNACWGNQYYEYCIDAPMQQGAPDLFDLYNQLYNDNPIIVTYRENNARIGHAVVITGIEGYFWGNNIYVTKVFIRDPWSDLINMLQNGFKVKSPREFFRTVTAHWNVDLQTYDTSQPMWLCGY
jgi:hypothetical protein